MQGLIAFLMVVLVVPLWPHDARANNLFGAARLAQAATAATRPLNSADVVITGISDGDTATAELVHCAINN